MVEYERGQVVMVRFKYPNASGREQQKDRPWLILSVGRFNESAGMFTGVPITSQEKRATPAHVKFWNPRRREENTILCEQIRSFDYRSGDYIVEHLGHLSKEILEKVDVALSVHCGFHYSPITLNNLYSAMEAIVKSVGHMQAKADTPKFTDNDVQDFTDKLISMAGKSLNLEDFSSSLGIVTEVTEETTVTETHEEVATTVEPPKVETSPKKDKWMKGLEEKKVEKETAKKRMKWTPEKMEEFWKDTEELPLSEVMKKWDFTKRSTYYSMKNYVKNKLQR